MIRRVRLGREPKGFAESTAQWRSGYPEEPHQSPIARNHQPFGLLADRCESSAELRGRFFHSWSDQRAIQNFVVQVVRPFFRQFEHFFKVS